MPESLSNERRRDEKLFKQHISFGFVSFFQAAEESLSAAWLSGWLQVSGDTKKKGGMTIFWHRSELGHCRCVYKGLFTTWGKLKGLAWTFPLKRRWATLVFRQVLKRERLHAVRDPCQTDQDLHIFPLMAIVHAELKLKPFSSKITFHGFYLSFVLHVSHSLSLPPHHLRRGRGETFALIADLLFHSRAHCQNVLMYY